MYKTEIKKIIESHIKTVNSFVDDNGKNHFKDIVDELNVLICNELWMIGSDIMKKAGVKGIKTTYSKK